MLNVEKAWEITKGSKDVIVAVIHSGISFSNKLPQILQWENVEEMSGKPGIDDDQNGYIDDFYGWDFVESDNDPTDVNSSIFVEGTYVSGILAASHDGDGPLGIAPDISLMNLRVMGLDRSHSNIDHNLVAEAIHYAIANNATLINLSLHLVPHIGSQLLTAFHDAGMAGIPIFVPTVNFPSGMFTDLNDDWLIGVTGPSDGSIDVSYGRRPKYDILALMLSIRNDLPVSFIGQVLVLTSNKEMTDTGYVRNRLDIFETVDSWKNFESIFEEADGTLAYSEENEALGSTAFDLVLSLVLLEFLRRRRK
jgi:hypothetical protein